MDKVHAVKKSWTRLSDFYLFVKYLFVNASDKRSRKTLTTSPQNQPYVAYKNIHKVKRFRKIKIKNRQKYIEAGVAILFPDKIEIRSK